MANWDIKSEREALEELTETWKEYQEKADQALEEGDRNQYYIYRDLAFAWKREARDCYNLIQWLEENNYG